MQNEHKEYFMDRVSPAAFTLKSKVTDEHWQ